MMGFGERKGDAPLIHANKTMKTIYHNTPTDKEIELLTKHQQEWMAKCKQHQADNLLIYKEILKPDFFKKLSTFIEDENKRRLSADNIRYDCKYILVAQAITKLLYPKK